MLYFIYMNRKSKNEIIRNSDAARDATPVPLQDGEVSNENLKQSSRLVIYGKKFGDANELTAAIKARLEEREIEDADVYYSYDVANIVDAFYGRRGRKHGEIGLEQSPQRALGSGALELTTSSKPGKLLKKFSKKSDQKDSAVYEDQSVDTLPLGVIIFPEMRAYHGHAGMTIDTPTSQIEEICKKHNVRLFYASKDAEPVAEIQQGMDALVQTPPRKEL